MHVFLYRSVNIEMGKILSKKGLYDYIYIFKNELYFYIFFLIPLITQFIWKVSIIKEITRTY